MTKYSGSKCHPPTGVQASDTVLESDSTQATATTKKCLLKKFQTNFTDVTKILLTSPKPKIFLRFVSENEIKFEDFEMSFSLTS